MYKRPLGLAYKTLGVGEDATAEEIQAALRARYLECHPDKNPNDPEAGKKFNDIMEARATLMKYHAEYQEERRQQEQQAKRSRTQQATDYTAVPGSASAAVGWQVAWQVSYPDSKGVDYWWDYDKQDIVTSMESARGQPDLLRFVYPWSGGRCVTYEADLVRGFVGKAGAKSVRKLRRVFVQSPPAAAVLNFGGSIRWQVLYKRRDVDYWCDYNATDSAALEDALANEELVAFCSEEALANEKVKINCQYEADPRNGVVRNLQNGRDQRLRRVLVADM